MRNRIELYHVRHARVRKKIAGTRVRPRMSIKVTNRFMYVQFIDDAQGSTLAAASSMKMDGKNNVATARLLGLSAAKIAKEVGIQSVVVDRGGHDWIAKFFDDLQGNKVVGNTYPHSFLLALEIMRNIVIGIQDKGERTG